MCGRAVDVAVGRAVAPSLCAAGWCGVVPRLWAGFLPFPGVRRLARVRPTVSVPFFGTVVCFGAPCCVVPCFAVLRRAGLCCVAVCSHLSCRAAPCRAVVCLAVVWLAALCCAVPRRVVLCFVVSWGALSWCVARRCVAVRCAVLLRAVPCLAVPWCVVGPFHCRSGIGWGRRWLDWPASRCRTRAEFMWLAGGWAAPLGVVWLLVSVLRGALWAAWPGELGGCPRGCPPWGPVPWNRVLWGSLPLGVCRVLVGRVSWPPRVCWVPSGPVPLPLCRFPSWVSRPCPLPPLVPVPLPVWWPLLWPGLSFGGEGVVVGCAAVFSAAHSVGVASSPRVGVPSVPCAGSGGRWSQAGAVHAASGPCCGGASWRVCTIRGWRGVRWGWGGAGPSSVACPSCLWPLVPAVAPSPSVSRPLALPFPGPWVVSCPRVVSPLVPCPVGACLLPWASPHPLAAGPPFALSLPGVVVVAFGGGACGAPMAHAWGWVIWSHRRRVSGV